MTLKDKIDGLLGTALRRTENQPRLKNVYNEIRILQQNFNQPLKVAVVGLIKAGKSTLINALIQQELLVTNHEEATYTITRFTYRDAPLLTIEFKDGSTIEDRIEALPFWTSRSYLTLNKRLNEVETVVIGYPNEIFKKLEIIDTPGLGSVYGVDSENTKELIGTITEEDNEKSTRLTQQAMIKADAILCAFKGNIKKNNLETLEKFLQHFGETGNPSNSIGVFTRCDDAYWNDPDTDPCVIAREICHNNYMKRNEIRRVLYNLMPITALPAQGMTHLNVEQFNLFKKLATIDSYELFELCSNADIFCDMELEDFVITLQERRELFSHYNRYGIYLMTQLVREGYDREGVRRKMLEKTGVKELLEMITNHFGNRSNIIKAQTLLNRFKTVIQETGIHLCNLDASEKYVLDDLFCECDTLLNQEHCFKELNALKIYYNKDIRLSEEDEDDLLSITGEYGYQCEARLGIKEGKSSIDELLEIAKMKMKKWSNKANSTLAKKNEQKLAEVLKRSCEIIYYHLEALSDY